MSEPPPISLVRSWKMTAGIAVLFGLAVFGVIIGFRLGARPADVLEAERLTALKQELQARPTDDQLKEQIRILDLQVRRRYFRQIALTTSGSKLLVVGAILFVCAGKRLFGLQRTLPRPAVQTDLAERTAAETKRMRWSVATVGITVAVTLIATGIAVGTTLPRDVRELAKATDPTQEKPAPGPSLEELRKHWPRFRGFDGSGVAVHTNVPLSWDINSGSNVLWKASLPEGGYSSPIVWSNRVFVSVGDVEKRAVICHEIETGDRLWERVVEVPSAPGAAEWEMSELGGAAAPTLASDGVRVYAMFGNGDVAALNFDGQVVWAKNLGVPANPYGHTSSLLVWRDRLIVQFDQGEAEEQKSKLYALDGATGRVVWQRKRAAPSSWATPIVIEAAGKNQIITLSAPWIIAYDAEEGLELWRGELLNGEVTPSPVYAGGLVLAISPNEALLAIRPDGAGDITKSHVVWSATDGVPDVASPAANDELVFALSSSGQLTCFDLKSGTKIWEHDFKLPFQASPTLVGNRLYLFGQEGQAIVVEAGREFKELARSEMHESIHASPAVVQGRIFIRTAKTLYCVCLRLI